MATSKSVTHEPAQQHLFGPNKTECDTHGQQLRSYCPSHLMPCCDECISQTHSKCIGISSLASVVEKTNIEKSKEYVGKDINFILNFLDKLAHNKSENIHRGEKQYQTIQESIGEIRAEFNNHLDNLEKKLCKEADSRWGEEKSKLTDFIKEIEEQKKRLKETQNDLRTVQENTSKLQSFLELHQIEQQVHQCQRYVDEQNETVIEVDIKLKKNDEIEQTFSKVQSLTSLGEVEVDETEITLRKETSVGREAQIVLQPNINNITMNLGTKIQIDSSIIDVVSDMIILFDGRVAVVESMGSVHIFTSDGKLQKVLLPNSGGARSVTQIKLDTIAVTYPNLKTIMMLNIENETTIKVIELDKRCNGLSFSNNALVVGLDRNEIRIIDLEGNTQKSIEVQSKSYLHHLVQWKDRVVYGDQDGKAVHCIDGSGKQIWQYQQDNFGPKGLCTDTYGNIMVADKDSDRLIVIFKDGQESKVLISVEDGLRLPTCICLNESSGFISNKNLLTSICIAKFNISYE